MQTMNASREQIVAELKKILAEDLFVEVPTEKMKDTDSFSTDLGLDSVGQIELVSLLEERYGLKIDVKESAADLKTIGSTADYILKNHQPVSKP
jgi:acyl carrier protein